MGERKNKRENTLRDSWGKNCNRKEWKKEEKKKKLREEKISLGLSFSEGGGAEQKQVTWKTIAATSSWPFLVVPSISKIKDSRRNKRGRKTTKENQLQRRVNKWIHFFDWKGMNLRWTLLSLTFGAFPYYQQTEMRKYERKDERTKEQRIGRTDGRAKGRSDKLINRKRASGQTSLLSRCQIQSQMRVCVQA